ncbi:MAG: hypothetical protein PW789_01530 [Edaphobacter sp.]|nr:hypothetical protein [Edaphobacter sp.]MDE1175272.1 hypothetical protein [Edaphobacter sp.]
MTSEMELRVEQHKQGRFEGYSKKYNCNRLVWFERIPLFRMRSRGRSS